MKDRLEKLDRLVTVLAKVPPDFWAVLMLVTGGVLALCGKKDEAQLVLGGALAVFRGQQPPAAS